MSLKNTQMCPRIFRDMIESKKKSPNEWLRISFDMYKICVMYIRDMSDIYLMLTISPTAHIFPLERVPLVSHPALRLVPHQLGDDLSVEEPNLDVHQQPETQTCQSEH